MSKLISIIIPVYNVEKYLHQCLDSILNQNSEEVEIICINDGSTDNSLNILNEYQDKIKIITQNNAGNSSARNLGITVARGKYLFFLDSDDYLKDNILDLIIKEVKNGYDLIQFGFTRVNEMGKIWHEEQNFGNRILSTQEAIIKFSPAPWNKIVKKNVLIDNKIEFPLGMKYEDLYYTLILLPYFHNIKCLDKSCINYRFNPNSIMQDPKILDGIFDTISSLIPHINACAEEIEYVLYKHLILGHLSRVAVGLPFKDLLIQINKTYTYINVNFPYIHSNKYFVNNCEKSKFLTFLLKLSKFKFFIVIVLVFYKIYSKFSKKIKRW